MKKLLLMMVCFALVGCTTSTKQEEKVIAYPDGYDTSEGAASYKGSGNHKDSAYFPNIDVFNLKNNDNLTILENFKTYQQTKEYSCGPAAALMVLHHFKNDAYDEMTIAKEMKTHQDLNNNNKEEVGVANEQGEYGTSTDRMVQFFKDINWNVSSSLDGKMFDTFEDFQKFVLETLRKNVPMMVEWIDWGGHWSDIIGYDTLGTDSIADDVLILADPYDTSDHQQDGYHIVSAERFYYMWLDNHILPKNQQKQQWIVAYPN